MRFGPSLDATRIRGTLEVEFQDGRKGTVDVDLDVSGPGASWSIDHEYNDEPDVGFWYRRPAVLLSTIYSVRIPASINQPDPAFTIRVPTGDS